MATKPDDDEGGNPLDNLLKEMQNMNLKSTDEQSKDTNEIKIPEWLTGCESPFLWHTEAERGLGSEMVIKRCWEKLEELKMDDSEFSLQRYTTLLKLVLEYYILGDMEKAWAAMTTVEDVLEKDVMSEDEAYQKVKLALGHVISATKANLLFLDGEEKKSKKIGLYIIPVKVMDDRSRACLQAMKAHFFLYSGYERGEDLAVEMSRKSLELEPNNTEWKYLLAKVLRQQRKDVPFSAEIPREELVLLESAVEDSKNSNINNSKYLVYLAQIYRECASLSFKNYRNRPGFYSSELYSTIQGMFDKSLNYYKEALELVKDHPGALRRIGYGIMNLPKKQADYNLALKCLLRSQELAANSITLHILGTFYHRYGDDNKKALEYFEETVKSQSHAGLSDFVRVKFIEDPDYDPCEDLEAGLKWGVKKKVKVSLLTQLGGYHLFIKRDFRKSIEYFRQAILEDQDSPHLTAYKSLFLRMYDAIDMYRYLANEALLVLRDESDGKNKSTSDDEDLNCNANNVGYVEDLLFLISEIHPELLEITPDPLLIQKLLDTSKEIIEKENYMKQKNNRPNDQGCRPKQRGRGARGGAQGRGNENSAERRGRFSIANQRENDHSDPDARRRHSGDARGGRGRYENNPRNWRNQPRGEGSEDHPRNDGKQGRDQENWRKK